jgi:heterodisulfide reductase subunit B
MTVSGNQKYLLFSGCLIETQMPQVERLALDVLPQIGVPLERVEFSCCPEPIHVRGASQILWLTLAARNLCKAESQGLNILSLCNGCVNTLAQTNHILMTDQNLREEVNIGLAELGLEFRGTIRVKHFLHAIYDTLGINGVKDQIQKPLDFLRVATHPGCHLLNPKDAIGFDDPIDPVIFDQMINALGAETVEHETKTMCCGVSLATTGDRMGSYRAIRTKLEDVLRSGGDCIAVGCPFCFRQYDTGQRLFRSKLNLNHPVPVYNYLQLLALALGFPMDEVFLNQNKIRHPEHMKAFQEA